MCSLVRFASILQSAFVTSCGLASAAQGRTVTLAQEYDSGIHGTATTVEEGDNLVVTITLTGRLGASPYLAHIHGGACDQPHVRSAYVLNPVIDGKSMTTLHDVSIATLSHGNYSIGIHSKVANVARHLACGAIG
jgi:hypothetical protein